MFLHHKNDLYIALNYFEFDAIILSTGYDVMQADGPQQIGLIGRNGVKGMTGVALSNSCSRGAPHFNRIDGIDAQLIM